MATGSSSSNDQGLVKGVVASVFEPGTNPELVRAMRYSFFALFATLAGMLVLTNGNLHVLFMLCVSLALFFSMTWFLNAIKDAELKARQEHKAQQGQPVETKKDK